jgi:DNA-binding sugar fermentation-stimulating protein
MRFQETLLEGRLIERYKRFLADVELDTGEVVTAHCANPGAMMGLKEPGSRVFLSRATNPNRKLKYNWEFVEVAAAVHGNSSASTPPVPISWSPKPCGRGVSLLSRITSASGRK